LASWLSDWYPGVVTAMRGLRGDGATGTDGNVMPLFQASDGIPVLGQISPGLVSAVRGYLKQDRVPRSDIVSADNIADILSGIADASTDGTSSISVAEYVSGVGYPGAAWRRSNSIGGELYEPFSVGFEYDLLTFVRQAMSDWQRAVDSAAIMLSNAVNASDIADQEASATFLSALRALCTDLDILRENPPMSTLDKLKGATRAAVDSVEDFAGKSAAQASEEVGRLAGNVSSGFFSQAGITSLVVAGIAVYLFVK
jgi:hypothetical protein